MKWYTTNVSAATRQSWKKAGMSLVVCHLCTAAKSLPSSEASTLHLRYVIAIFVALLVKLHTRLLQLQLQKGFIWSIARSALFQPVYRLLNVLFVRPACEP